MTPPAPATAAEHENGVGGVGVGRYGPSRRTPFPIVLQRRAPKVFRRHVWRGVVRGLALLVADAVTLVVLRAALRAVRDDAALGSGVASALQTLVPPGTYPTAQLLAGVVTGLLVFGNYSSGDHRRDPAMILAGSTLGLALIFWGRIWTDFSGWALLGFGFTSLIAGPALLLERLLIDAVVSRFRLRSRHTRRAMVVGPSEAARELLGRRGFRSRADFQFRGYLHTDDEHDPAALGGLDELIVVIEREHVDTLILAGDIEPDVFAVIVDCAAAAGCHVFSIPTLFAGEYIQPQLVWRSGLPLIQLTRPSLRAQQLAVKRAVDLIGAAGMILLLSPVLLLIAVLIKLDSRGPIFFAHTRVGFGGARFRMLKFRTMRNGADLEKAHLQHLNASGDPRLFKIANDPRITRFGAWLRKWSLDELPQLFNVLAGSMSLVGPRPFPESDLIGYEDHHFWRLGAKPGMTGLWQVGGRSTLLDFEEVVRLDREYITRWSLGLDVRILALTVPAVLRRAGAY